MLKYIGKRILFMIPLLLGITIICFFVMHLAPGSPTDLQTQMNPKASAQMKERLQALYELDKPIHVQYWSWLKNLVTEIWAFRFRLITGPSPPKLWKGCP